MRGFRIDPTRIKMTEPKPRARGGQASISIGTLIPREEVATWLPEQLLKSVLDLNLAVKKFEWDREDVEESAKSFKVEPLLTTTTQVAFLITVPPLAIRQRAQYNGDSFPPQRG